MNKTIPLLLAFIISSCSSTNLEAKDKSNDFNLDEIRLKSKTLSAVTGVEKPDLKKLTQGVKSISNNNEAWKVVDAINTYPKPTSDEAYKRLLRIVATEPRKDMTLDGPFNNLIQTYEMSITKKPNRELEILLLAAYRNSKKKNFHGGLQPNEYVIARHASKLGKFYIKKRRYKEAEPYLKDALSFFAKTKYLIEIYSLKRDLLISYIQQGKFDEALPLYKWILKFDSDFISPGFINNSMKQIAAHYLSIGQKEEAKALLKRATKFQY